MATYANYMLTSVLKTFHPIIMAALNGFCDIYKWHFQKCNEFITYLGFLTKGRERPRSCQLVQSNQQWLEPHRPSTKWPGHTGASLLPLRPRTRSFHSGQRLTPGCAQRCCYYSWFVSGKGIKEYRYFPCQIDDLLLFVWWLWWRMILHKTKVKM